MLVIYVTHIDRGSQERTVWCKEGTVKQVAIPALLGAAR
jgi:hypothetical protein